MNRFAIPALILSAATLLSGAARAMEIQQYDKMASEDKGEYFSLLVGGAEQVLKDEGRADLAAKVEDLFTGMLPGDQISIGIGEFERYLARARVTDTKNIANDPHAHRLEVEDAMAVTLKKNGIDLPQSFFTVNSNFRPKYLSQKQ